MSDKAGFELFGEFYEWPTSFRLGDPVLVRELTGMDFTDFAEGLDDPERGLGDPLVLLGVIGTAIWQKNPRWRRDKVVRYVEGIPQESLELVGGDADVPPPEAAEAAEDTADASQTSKETVSA